MASSPATGSGRSNWLRRGRSIVLVSGWLYLVVVAVAGALAHSGDRWPLATLVMFAPLWWLVVPAGLLLPAALVLRRWVVLPVLAALLVLVPVSAFNIPASSVSDVGSGFRLRVLTCNLHYTNPGADRLGLLLDELQPDVAVFQEWRHAREIPGLGPDVQQSRPDSSHYIVSRFPIVRAEPIAEKKRKVEGSFVRYELATDTGPLVFISAHLASPRHGLWTTYRGHEDGTENLAENGEIRRGQLDLLARLASEAPGPVVVAGDLNTPPQSALFDGYWPGHIDSFAEAGWGWGHTFLANRTAVRIDYVLAGPGWRCDRCVVARDVGSPHRPVLADLRWTGPSSR